MMPIECSSLPDGASRIVVGVGELRLSDDARAVLVTHALGSCIAVCVHDPLRSIAAMVHFMLPDSSIAPTKARAQPALFADTGIPLLFRELYARGSKKQELTVKMLGGATAHDDQGVFEIGKRNYAKACELFARHGVHIAARDVGGEHWRTAFLWVGSGRLLVRSPGPDKEL